MKKPWYKKLTIEKWFLILAIPLGILYMLLIPVGDGPDEPSHFLRANEASKGVVMMPYNEDKGGAGVYVDQETYEAAVDIDHSYSDVLRHLGHVATDEQDVYYNISNISVYSFICYLPQAVGMAIGNLLHLPILVIAYLGRLTNFIFWLVVLYLCIKHTPVLKKVIFLVSLLPITMQQATSLSPDASTYAVAVGLFCFVMYQMQSKEKMGRKDYVIMTLLTLVMGANKYVYLPLCLLLFLIPKERFGNKRKKYIYIGAMAAIVVVMNIVWFLLTANFFQEPEGVNSGEQLQVLMSNPLRYIWVLINTVLHQGDFLVNSMFGRYLERFNINLSFVPVLILIIVFSVMCYKYRKAVVRPATKYLPMFIVAIVTIMSATVMFLKWTPVGQSYIEGLQGRYFLPILYMVPLLLMKTDKKAKGNLTSVVKIEQEDATGKGPALPIILVVINVIALALVMRYHLAL